MQTVKGNVAKAPDSPEIMHCFDDRYREGKHGSQSDEKQKAELF